MNDVGDIGSNWNSTTPYRLCFRIIQHVPNDEKRRRRKTMNQIKFSKNWNDKLRCDYWTTIRLYTREKAIYYTGNIEQDFNVVINGRKYCEARLVGVCFTALCTIPEHLTYTDAAMNRQDFTKLMAQMYSKKPEWKERDTKFIILTFKRANDDDTTI